MKERSVASQSSYSIVDIYEPFGIYGGGGEGAGKDIEYFTIAFSGLKVTCQGKQRASHHIQFYEHARELLNQALVENKVGQTQYSKEIINGIMNAKNRYEHYSNLRKNHPVKYKHLSHLEEEMYLLSKRINITIDPNSFEKTVITLNIDNTSRAFSLPKESHCHIFDPNILNK
jgi:hypothetical protein